MLNVGTSTTNGGIAATRPANGSFTTFLVQPGSGALLSSNGVSAAITAAPEPGSIALLLPVVGVAGMVIRKRRKK